MLGDTWLHLVGQLKTNTKRDGYYTNKWLNFFQKGPLPRLFSSFFGYFIPLFYSNTSCYGVFRPKTEYRNHSLLVAFRQCDLYDESDKAVFVKYGESPEELNKTFTDLARLFEATGVEKYKIDYILNAVKQRER